MSWGIPHREYAESEVKAGFSPGGAMKRRISGAVKFVAGFILGALVFGGAAAVAAGLTATPKTAEVIIDGKIVDLEGYVIESSHYFKLRDLSSALAPSGKDFSIAWDGRGNRIIIDTNRGYGMSETLGEPEPGSQDIAQQTMTIDEMKAEIVRLTNIERVNAGLPELAAHPLLMATAQGKAQDFMDNHYFGHISPVYGTPTKMILASVPGIRTCGENLSAWNATAQGAFEGWLESPEHRDNILAGKFTHIGVGIIEGVDGGYWWVQQFIGF